MWFVGKCFFVIEFDEFDELVLVFVDVIRSLDELCVLSLYILSSNLTNYANYAFAVLQAFLLIRGFDDLCGLSENVFYHRIARIKRMIC